MITRSLLAEQIREYQIRSKQDWAAVSFFSSTSNVSSSRVDVVVFVTWELVTGFLCSVSVFQEYASGFDPGICHVLTSLVHENNKASEIS